MKLAKKAYKIVFPFFYSLSERVRMWDDSEIYSVSYGENMKEAVNCYCRENDDIVPYWELKKNIRARRFKEADVFTIDKSIELIGLSMIEVQHILHSLGVGYNDICPDSFHRNYSLYYEPNKEFNNLLDTGLVTVYKKMGSYCYVVTEKGEKAAKTLLLLTKNQINDINV